MRPLLVATLAGAILALALAPSPAAAQTLAAPIQGNYDEVYVIAGRAIDKDGFPLSGGNVTIEIPGAAPLRAGLNCKGDFLASFPIRHVEADQVGRVRLHALTEGDDDVAEFKLDPFYRRNDVTLRLDGAWMKVCAREQNVWDVSASIAIRVLNRTEPYQAGGETFHARPYAGLVDLYFEAPGGNRVCAPHPQIQREGVCERFIPDVRGDVRYTFTLDQPFPGGGRIEVTYADNKTLFLDVDAETRIVTSYLEVSGRGAPRELYETPGAPAILLVGVLAVVAMAFSSKRR